MSPASAVASPTPVATSCLCCTVTPAARVSWWVALGIFTVGAVWKGLQVGALVTIKDNFDTSYFMVALAAASFDAAQVLSSLQLAHIENRYEPELICACGMGLSVVGVLLYGIGAHISMLIIGNFILGAGMAPVIVFLPAIITRLEPNPSHVPRYIALAYALGPVGVVAGFIVWTVSEPEWKIPHMCLAAVFVIPMLGLLSVYHGYKSIDPRTPATKSPPLGRVIRALLSNRLVMLLLIAQAGVAFALSAYGSFIAAYLEEDMGQGKDNAAYIMAGQVPVITFSIILSGAFSAKAQLQPPGMIASAALCALTMIPLVSVFLFVDAIPFGVFLGFVILAMMFGFFGGPMALSAIALAVDPSIVGHCGAVSNMFIRLFGAVPGPIVLGVFLDSDGTMSNNTAMSAIGYIGFGVASVFFTTAFLLAKFQPSRPDELPGPTDPYADEELQ